MFSFGSQAQSRDTFLGRPALYPKKSGYRVGKQTRTTNHVSAMISACRRRFKERRRIGQKRGQHPFGGHSPFIIRSPHAGNSSMQETYQNKSKACLLGWRPGFRLPAGWVESVILGGPVGGLQPRLRLTCTCGRRPPTNTGAHLASSDSTGVKVRPLWLLGLTRISAAEPRMYAADCYRSTLLYAEQRHDGVVQSGPAHACKCRLSHSAIWQSPSVETRRTAGSRSVPVAHGIGGRPRGILLFLSMEPAHHCIA